MNRLPILLLAGATCFGQPSLTPAQMQVLRQYQAAELARADCQTFIRIGRPDPAHRTEGPYRIERSPEKTAAAAALYTALAADARAAFGPDHPQTALVLSGLARLEADQGIRLDLAEKTYLEALAILRKANSPETSGALLELGRFYRQTGRYLEAETCLEQSRALGMGKGRAQRALGQVAQDLGDYARAQALFQEALALQQGAPVEAARTLTLQAALSVKQGDPARCGSLAEEALRLIDAPGSGATSGDRFAAGMASTIPLICQGQILAAGRKANHYFFSGLDLEAWAQYLGELNEDAYPAIIRQRTWVNQGLAHLLEAAEEQTRQTFGDHHPQLAEALANSALLHLARKDWDQALPAAVQANVIHFQNLPAVFNMASERLKLQYLEKTERYRDLLLSALVSARREGPDLEEALTWALRLKGIVLDAMVGEREALRGGLDPGLRATLEQLRQTRQELSSLYIRGPEADLEGFKARMAGLTQSLDALESRLSQGSAAYRETRDRLWATPAEVRARMPRDSALVEYFAFNQAAGPGAPPWLAACVLQPGAPAILVDLGPAAPIEQAISAWRRELQTFASGRESEPEARRRLDGQGRQVAALLWDPVAARVPLTHKGVVYIAPDGPVHLMPLAPLPWGSGYLIEAVNLAYVSTGKDFLREKRPSARAGALLVGGIDFESRTPQVPATARGLTQAARLNELRWNPLPGTAEEVDAIASALTGAHLRATLLKGAQADKAAVFAGFQEARYIHLATHGFFLGDAGGSGAGGRGVAVQGRLEAAPTSRPENPLLLSGLALAGANRGGGYLLAMDVAGLDLEGVDLVTLSACETGLGDIRRGEGVFGLQRSFLMAGAQALVMSLWSVPDQETRDLMVTFYLPFLAGATGHDAFRQSQLKLVKAGRHPYFWAAFQYLGTD